MSRSPYRRAAHHGLDGADIAFALFLLILAGAAMIGGMRSALDAKSAPPGAPGATAASQTLSPNHTGE